MSSQMMSHKMDGGSNSKEPTRVLDFGDPKGFQLLIHLVTLCFDWRNLAAIRKEKDEHYNAEMSIWITWNLLLWVTFLEVATLLWDWQ